MNPTPDTYAICLIGSHSWDGHPCEYGKMKPFYIDCWSRYPPLQLTKYKWILFPSHIFVGLSFDYLIIKYKARLTEIDTMEYGTANMKMSNNSIEIQVSSNITSIIYNYWSMICITHLWLIQIDELWWRLWSALTRMTKPITKFTIMYTVKMRMTNHNQNWNEDVIFL